ncbi:MAG TPA: signal peptide peptidase SppA [Nitrospiraceae bacterium]|nr:signal peptide peptidase SppA [Nitrospiraceae bacterium]
MKKGCLFFLGFIGLLIIISAIITLAHRVPLTDRVALIRIEGLILDSKAVIDELKEYSRDPLVKAIVLRIDSPGGGVAPTQEIYEEVKKAKEKKKVVVSMGSVAASGGYYIASAADKIVANPGTLTGSIGAVMEIPNFEGLMEKIGVRTEVIKSGRHKDIASVFRSMSPEERGILQSVLDDVHDQFIKAVAEGRNMKVDYVRSLADGRIFTGNKAKDLGLVDEIGNLEDTILLAAELSGIEGEPEVVTRKEEFNIFELLRKKFPKDLSEVFPTIRLKYILIP